MLIDTVYVYTCSVCAAYSYSYVYVTIVYLVHMHDVRMYMSVQTHPLLSSPLIKGTIPKLPPSSYLELIELRSSR